MIHVTRYGFKLRDTTTGRSSWLYLVLYLLQHFTLQWTIWFYGWNLCRLLPHIRMGLSRTAFIWNILYYKLHFLNYWIFFFLHVQMYIKTIWNINRLIIQINLQYWNMSRKKILLLRNSTKTLFFIRFLIVLYILEIQMGGG